MAATTAVPPLPDGWIARVSRKKGKVFYFHKETNKTQWEFPTETPIIVESEKEDQVKKDPLLAGITRAMKVGGTEISKRSTTTFRPWNHQVEAVHKLLLAIRDTSQRQFLIQHSTGSGKSKSV